MVVNRLVTQAERVQLKQDRKFQGKVVSELTQVEKDELLEIIAKKLKLL